MKQSISLFMVMLFVLWPMYSADAMASINATAYGEQGIPGYAKTSDTITYEARILLEGDDTIEPSQVKAGSFSFQNCVASIGSEFVCTYIGAIENVVASTYNIGVQLYNDAGTKVEETTFTLTFDNTAPTVTINAATQFGENMSVSYEVTDSACASCSGCSGIAKLVFRDGGRILLEENVNENSCTYTNSSLMGIPLETNTITIDAYDKFGLIGSSTYNEIGLDENNPQIQTNSLKILKEGFLIKEYIGAGEHTVDIKFDVKEENLDYVTVDLTEFGLGNVNAECTGIEDLECIINGVTISTTENKNYKINIYAKDGVGRYDNKTITKTLNIDAAGGEVVSISTPYVYQESSYIGPNGANIKVIINDQGAGFNRGEVYLDLKDLNSAYSNAEKADNCTLVSSGTWECNWYNKSSNTEGIATVLVNNFFSKDDAGNILTGKLEERFKIDKTAPVISGGITILGISEIGPPLSYLVARGGIQIGLTLEDETQINGVADLSALITTTGMDKVGGACVEIETGKWSCSWDTGRIRDGYHSDLKIQLEFIDTAGNKLTHEIQGLEIFPRDEVETPDYWGIKSVNAMPKSIDRAVAPIFGGRQVFALELDNGGSDILPINIELKGCTGAEAYTRNQYLLNKQPGSKNPMLFLDLEKFDAEGLKKIDFTCTLQIISLVPYRTEQRVSNIEEETINLSIGLFNAPFGELGAGMENEIQTVKDKYIDGGLWKIVGKMRKIFAMASKLCTFYNMFRSVTHLIEMIRRFTSLAKWKAKLLKDPTLLARPDVQEKAKCVKVESIETAGDKSFKFMNKLCDWINCKCKPEKDGNQLKDAGGFLGKTCGISGRANINFLGSKGVTDKFAKSTFNHQSTAREYTNPTGYMNVRDNLILSLIPPPCVPGIIYNLEKYRQIQCMYASCLQSSVTTGASVAACSQIKSYMTCKYVIGQIFNAIPIIAFWNHLMSQIKNALSDPLSAVGAIFAINCVKTCTKAGHPAGETIRASCIVPKMVAEIGDAIANIKAKQDPWDLEQTLGADYCEDLSGDEEGGLFG